MNAIPDYQQSLAAGVSRAKRELGHPENGRLAEREVGTALKYALLALLEAEWGEISALRRRLRGGEVTREMLAASARAVLPGLCQAALKADAEPSEVLHPSSFILQPSNLSRVVELALDAIASERLSPELLLFPPGSAVILTANKTELLPSPVHALIFSAFPNVTNELYPLLVDAYVAGFAHGDGLLLGIHESWLIGNRCRRAILLDADTQELIETDLSSAPVISSAQVLALNLAEEAAGHQRLERALTGIPFLNPYSGAAVLDDKAATAAIWQRAGLPTPRLCVFAPDADLEEIISELAAFISRLCPATECHLVLKPAGGTEGRGVSFYAPQSIADIRMIAGEIQRQEGAVLVAEERGAVRYAAPVGPVRCTVRLNVCWDGATAWVESGYAQIAATPEGVASAGRGGGIIPLSLLWRKLCHADGAPFSPTEADWSKLLATASEGISALAAALGTEMPVLTGVDMLLDVDTAGALAPVLLEANPRPAGMGHSHFVSTAGPTEEPGVTLRQWKVVRKRGNSAVDM